MDKKLVCPCGLTCCDCLFYKSEIYDTAQKLKDLIKEHELDRFLAIVSNKKSLELMGEHLGLSENQIRDEIGKNFNAFKQMPEFLNILDSIIKLQCKSTCKESGGCSIVGRTHECKALKCIKSKNYEGCWQCGEFEDCNNLKFLKGAYGYVIDENLKTIRDKGVGAVMSHGNKYYAWQRQELKNK